MCSADTPARADARRHDHGIELGTQVGGDRRIGGIDSQAEHDAKLVHKGHAALDHVFRKLHIGNAVHEQPAGAVVALNDRHQRPAPRELPCGSKPRRPRSHHGNPRRILGSRLKPVRTTVRPFPIGNGAFVVVDGRGLVAHPAKVARSLAKGRAHTARELRQRRGKRETLGGLGPSSAIHELVPLRDEVVERAAARASAAKRTAHLAKRNPAHHAAARLSALGIFIEVHIELVVVANALAHRAQRMCLAIPLKKCSRLPHRYPLSNLIDCGQSAPHQIRPLVTSPCDGPS